MPVLARYHAPLLEAAALAGGNEELRPLRQHRALDNRQGTGDDDAFAGVIGGDIAAFKGKENKTVEVTGLVGERESGASTNGQYGPGSTTGVGYDTIIAKSVKVVVDNCS